MLNKGMDILSMLKTEPHNHHYLERYYHFVVACQDKNKNQKQRTKRNPTGHRFEFHHICPRSMFKSYICFKTNPWNKARLTSRQHFIAHKLLWKAYGGSMTQAFYFMSKNKHSQFKLSSKQYTDLQHEVIQIRISRNLASKWINNGIKEKFTILSEDLIGQGWKKGRLPDIFKGTRDLCGEKNPAFGNKRPDLAKRNQIKKRWMTDGQRDIHVLLEDVETYIKHGFKIGRNKVSSIATIADPCVGCGVPFERKAYKIDGRLAKKYCSDKCRKHYTGPKSKNCEYCGKEFVRYGEKNAAQKCCSNTCKVSLQRKDWPKCVTCSDKFKPSKFRPNRKHCSSKCKL